jgi:hypothetical protein
MIDVKKIPALSEGMDIRSYAKEFRASVSTLGMEVRTEECNVEGKKSHRIPIPYRSGSVLTLDSVFVKKTPGVSLLKKRNREGDSVLVFRCRRFPALAVVTVNYRYADEWDTTRHIIIFPER